MNRLIKFIFRILSSGKNYIKTVALINMFATCASASTASHVFINDSVPNSIVPFRPLQPITPTKVAHEIIKMNSVNTQDFCQLDLLVKYLAASKVVNKN